DEYDRLAQTNVPKFLQRLAAPTSLKLLRRFSNPSFPEAGIDERYLATDQRSWLIRCPSCRYEAPVAYASADEGEHTVDELRGALGLRRGRRGQGPARAERPVARRDRQGHPPVPGGGRGLPRARLTVGPVRGELRGDRRAARGAGRPGVRPPVPRPGVPGPVERAGPARRRGPGRRPGPADRQARVVPGPH